LGQRKDRYQKARVNGLKTENDRQPIFIRSLPLNPVFPLPRFDVDFRLLKNMSVFQNISGIQDIEAIIREFVPTVFSLGSLHRFPSNAAQASRLQPY